MVSVHATKVQIFLISATDGGEWLTSPPDRFILGGKKNSCIHHIGGWMGHRATLNVIEKRQISFPYWDSNRRPFSL
jgi:hypothetical protein